MTIFVYRSVCVWESAKARMKRKQLHSKVYPPVAVVFLFLIIYHCGWPYRGSCWGGHQVVNGSIWNTASCDWTCRSLTYLCFFLDPNTHTHIIFSSLLAVGSCLLALFFSSIICSGVKKTALHPYPFFKILFYRTHLFERNQTYLSLLSGGNKRKEMNWAIILFLI